MAGPQPIEKLGSKNSASQAISSTRPLIISTLHKPRESCNDCTVMNAIDASESIFTAEEIATKHKLHPATIRKLFLDEPGVIRLGHPARGRRRQYYTLRIPASVVQRVFQKMTVQG